MSGEKDDNDQNDQQQVKASVSCDIKFPDNEVGVPVSEKKRPLKENKGGAPH